MPQGDLIPFIALVPFLIGNINNLVAIPCGADQVDTAGNAGGDIIEIVGTMEINEIFIYFERCGNKVVFVFG